MIERPIDELRIDIVELQAQTKLAREELQRLWVHAVVVTAAVLLTVTWIWLAERDQ